MQKNERAGDVHLAKIMKVYIVLLGLWGFIYSNLITAILPSIDFMNWFGIDFELFQTFFKAEQILFEIKTF